MPGVAATNGVRESNHSYGFTAGWSIIQIGANYYWLWGGEDTISTLWDWHFGYYNSTSVTNGRDHLFPAQTYLPVYSAGNANDPNDDGPATQPFAHYEYSNNVLIVSSGIRPLNNYYGGLFTVTADAVCKNNLVVGAVGVNTNGYSGTNSVTIANFASQGPRICTMAASSQTWLRTV